LGSRSRPERRSRRTTSEVCANYSAASPNGSSPELSCTVGRRVPASATVSLLCPSASSGSPSDVPTRMAADPCRSNRRVQQRQPARRNQPLQQPL